MAEYVAGSNNGQQFVPQDVSNFDSCQEDYLVSPDCSVSWTPRISEQHQWVWDTLESPPGVDVAATRSSLLNRLDSLSSPLTTGFGVV